MILRRPSAPLRWQHWLEYFARLSWLIVAVAVVFGLVAGTITAATGVGDERGSWPSPGYRPPLFFVIANGLYVAAILLSLPSLIAALPALGARHWRTGLTRLLHGLAPAVVYAGFFLGSHYVGCTGVRWLCEGEVFTGRVHLLHHTTVAALPLALIFAAGLFWLKRGIRMVTPAHFAPV